MLAYAASALVITKGGLTLTPTLTLTLTLTQTLTQTLTLTPTPTLTRRSDGMKGDTSTRDSVVNQLLARHHVT